MLRQRSYFVEAVSCPVSTKSTGGIRGGMEYPPYFELTVGASQIAEQVHCILGSLNRAVESLKENPNFKMRGDIAHIKEEVGLIHKRMNEYRKDIYTDMIMNGRYKPDYTKEGMESLNKSSVSLRQRALKFLGKTQSAKQLSPDFMAIAVACYRVLIALSLAMQAGVKKWPDSMKNPFRDNRLKKEVAALDKAVKGAFG